MFRFSNITGPLVELTRKDTPFVWSTRQISAFDELKRVMTSAPVLKLFDSTLPTRLVCDASDFCIGSVLE